MDVFTEEGEQEGEGSFASELTVAYTNGNIIELKESNDGDRGKEEGR